MDDADLVESCKDRENMANFPLWFADTVNAYLVFGFNWFAV